MLRKKCSKYENSSLYSWARTGNQYSRYCSTARIILFDRTTNLKEKILHAITITVACNIYEKKTIFGGKCYARIFSEELTKIQKFLFMWYYDESMFTWKGVLNSYTYARMGRRESVSDAAQKFPSSLKIECLGWDYGNKNIGASNPPRKTKWRIICAIFDRKSDFLEDVLLLDRNKIIFQDGASPHNARMDFLNQQFPARWIIRYAGQ